MGAGIARGLAAAGAAVAVNYATDRAGADAVVGEITTAGGRAIAVPGDVSKSADVARMLAAVGRAFGPLDVLVNNAGVYRATPLEAVTEAEFHREFDTNVLGPLLVTREALGHFGPGGGSVINIGSGASRTCPPGYSVYAATKGALDAVTGVLARELAPRKIRVNSVNPGATLSEGIRRKLLDDGHIDTVIGLPANLFYSTGIPVCVLVLKKCKKPDVVLFINAAERFQKGKRQNQLTDEHIEEIIGTYQKRKTQARYSRRVSMKEIESNDYNLNISRYVSTAEQEADIDLKGTHAELIKLEKDIQDATARHNRFLVELGLPPLPSIQ